MPPTWSREHEVKTLIVEYLIPETSAVKDCQSSEDWQSCGFVECPFLNPSTMCSFPFMLDSNAVLDALKRLPPPVFAEVCFRFKIPPEYQRPGAQVEQAIELVRYAEMQNRLPELAALVPQKTTQANEKPQFFLLPSGFNPKRFTQRDEMLATLAHRLQTQRRVALCGLGGMGKTQIALYYAHLHRTAYRAVLWVSADSPQRLQAELAALAEPLGLPTAQEQALNVRQVLNWLSAVGWVEVRHDT